ncbi:hypothetical protein MMC11_008412 [Xylographa trunciseda]|nr:hypothetical protein [Xylographa trunciseda]
MSDSASPAGVSPAIKRLEEANSSLKELLTAMTLIRDTQEEAIKEAQKQANEVQEQLDAASHELDLTIIKCKDQQENLSNMSRTIEERDHSLKCFAAQVNTLKKDAASSGEMLGGLNHQVSELRSTCESLQQDVKDWEEKSIAFSNSAEGFEKVAKATEESVIEQDAEVSRMKADFSNAIQGHEMATSRSAQETKDLLCQLLSALAQSIVPPRVM